MKRWILQIVAMVGLLLVPAPPLLAQAAPDTALLQLSVEDRLTAVKTDYGITLGTAQKTRIGNVCKTAQNILQQYAVQSKETAAAEDRTHAAVITRMGSLQSLFEVTKIEYPAFALTITEYSRNFDDFKRAYELHHALLQDAVALDCTADPEGFKALVAAARASYPMVESSRQSLKAYLDEQARLAIESIKSYIGATE